MQSRSSLAALGLLVALVILAVPSPAGAQPPIPLPPVPDFVNNLDLKCYQIPGIPLHLDHLNPLFQKLQIPSEDVVIQQPQELCVPVQKNNNVPPPSALPFLQFVDLRCYPITDPPLNQPLRLTHLNPVIAQMFGPIDDVTVQEPQQLCVPVLKNNPPPNPPGPTPPPEVVHLIQYLDLKCYRVDSNRVIGGEPITLTHLNPLFANLPPEIDYFVGPAPIQLCVPVAKNGLQPPSDVLPIIQASDVLCYKLRGNPLNQRLQLTHLNPVIYGQGFSPDVVPVTDVTRLCVPVSKALQPPPPPPPHAASK
jgi:hypothetical protein